MRSSTYRRSHQAVVKRGTGSIRELLRRSFGGLYETVRRSFGGAPYPERVRFPYRRTTILLEAA